VLLFKDLQLSKMAGNKIDEIRLDIAELKQLHDSATRSKVKGMLTIELRRLETELIALSQAEQPAEPKHNANKPKPTCYETKIINYAWDQSDKFVKIYVTLNGIQSLPKEQIRCTFTGSSFELRVEGLDSRNHTLLINNLLHPITLSSSYHKVKTDMVIVFLSKTAQKSWSHVTQSEQKAKEQKDEKLKPEAAEDPSGGLMNIMKKMYDEGDDDMKRTIAKAWTESRDKQQGGGDFPSL